MGSRILVLDGNVAEMRARQMAALGYDGATTTGSALRTPQANPFDPPLLWKHGLGPAIRTKTLRILEIRNRLQAIVLLRRRQRV
jgi:hypothetical protein